MLPAHGRAELDLEIYTEPPLTAKAEFKLSKAYRWPSGFRCVRYGPQTRQSGFGLWTEGGGRPWRSVRTQESPSSYGLTSPSLTPGRLCMSACGSPIATGCKPTPLLRYHGSAEEYMYSAEQP